jgi:GT2 family glycosyltransferase
MNAFAETPGLSICIVGLNASDYLHACIEAIQKCRLDLGFEIIYVDNHSSDSSVEQISTDFPSILVIKNDENLGYSKANNQALRLARGSYLLLLNPDTLVGETSLQVLVDYLDSQPQTGIAGPKVLNADGSFQAHCKRGEARPWEVLCYFLGLSRLFPRHPLFSGYLQSFLDEDAINDVPAISGSCMLIRRQVIDQIGLLDEAFFAYQEDTDYCVRARQAGWKVTYVPDAKIIHYGGKGGTRVAPFKTIFEWHRSYYLYYRKHLAHQYFFLLNWFIYCLMLMKLLFSLLINIFRTEKHAGPKRG